MSAEQEGLPDLVMHEVQAFTDVNVAWLRHMLVEAAVVEPDTAEERAKAIFAAIAGAQLVARSRSDIGLFDNLVEAYQKAGLLPS